MTRLKDTILEKKGYNTGNAGPMVDVRNGGQNGATTDFRSYVSNSSYVKRNLVAVLIEAPTGFQLLQDSAYWVETLKALVELHPKSIEGLQSTLTVEHIENAVGGSGEMQQDVSNVTRARSTPTFTWNEKYGKPISTFLNGWVTNLIMDPITKYPAVVSNGTVELSDLLPDFNGMTVLFFEPDPTFTKITEAWLCTNMRPNGTVAEITGRRDLTAAGEGADYSVEFTALTQVGEGVRKFAETILNNMVKEGLNPNQSNAFIENIHADVDTDSNGYSNQLQDMANNTVS